MTNRARRTRIHTVADLKIGDQVEFSAGRTAYTVKKTSELCATLASNNTGQLAFAWQHSLVHGHTKLFFTR